MTQLKDVIHLYLGCEVEFNLGTHGRVTGSLIKNINEDYPLWFKPILRPLSDMTEKEMQECGNLVYDFSDDEELNKWEWTNFQVGLCSEQFLWLLQHHFDLFELIESGQAISKTTIHPIPGEQN